MKLNDNQIAMAVIVVVTVTAMFVLKLDSKEIVMAAIGGIVGYLGGKANV